MIDPERPLIRDLLVPLAAEARRHDGSLRIEHARGRWRASLLNDHGDLLAVRDTNLEPALVRLWAAVGGARLDHVATRDVDAIEIGSRQPQPKTPLP